MRFIAEALILVCTILRAVCIAGTVIYTGLTLFGMAVLYGEPVAQRAGVTVIVTLWICCALIAVLVSWLIGRLRAWIG